MDNTDYTVGTEEAQTIRELVINCQKAQEEIEAQLAVNFNRRPDGEEKPTGSSNYPNVLDEIMDSLKALYNSQCDTIELIKKYINPKL